MSADQSTEYLPSQTLRQHFDLPEAGREIRDPATQDVVGWAPQPGAEDIDRAVSTARSAQEKWAELADDERCGILMQVADAIEQQAEPLAQLLSREQGKPLNGPNARFEIQACVGWLRATANFKLEPETLFEDDTGKAVLYYKPAGVVGAIGPWNWPMMISTWQIAPSLRMGNAVVLKPSEYTPLSVLALAHVFNSVLPENLLQVVAGEREVGEAISTHPGIDKIMFTGSTQTGKAIIKAAADTLKLTTMELGGNDAGIVLDDVNPSEIAADLFWGAFINTGQTCACLKRLYVHDSVYDEVCEELERFAKTVPMGPGLNEHNLLGPLQNAQQLNIVTGLVEAAKDGGARVIMGGTTPPSDQIGYFYPTTLIADIDKDNALVVEEQFGPVLPIIRYQTLDQAIEWANELPVGLGSSAWSSDPERALAVAQRLEAGTTWINMHGQVDPRMPFGGIKQSGQGVEFGVEGLKQVAVQHVIKQ